MSCWRQTRCSTDASPETSQAPCCHSLQRAAEVAHQVHDGDVLLDRIRTWSLGSHCRGRKCARPGLCKILAGLRAPQEEGAAVTVNEGAYDALPDGVTDTLVHRHALQNGGGAHGRRIAVAVLVLVLHEVRDVVCMQAAAASAAHSSPEACKVLYRH